MADSFWDAGGSMTRTPRLRLGAYWTPVGVLLKRCLRRPRKLADHGNEQGATGWLRFILIMSLTIAAFLGGFLLIPADSTALDASLTQPILGVATDKPSSVVSADITSVDLSPESIGIDMAVTTTDPNTNLYFIVAGPKFSAHPASRHWTVSYDGVVGFVKIPLKTAGSYADVRVSASLDNCKCYKYESPYLSAVSVSLDSRDALSVAADGALAPWAPHVSPVPATVIQRNTLSLRDQGLPSVWSTIGQDATPPSQLPDDLWVWANSTFGAHIRLTSVDNADESEHRFFWAGLLLGVAGAGVFASIDSGLALREKRRGKATKIGQSEHPPLPTGVASPSDTAAADAVDQLDHSIEPTGTRPGANWTLILGTGLVVAAASGAARAFSRGRGGT